MIPKVLALFVTLHCPANCSHCSVKPLVGKIKPADMPLDTMLKAIREATMINTMKVVVFTGGEPLLVRESIVRGIEYAKKFNLITRVVTNAFWAADIHTARSVVRMLRESGLDEINISYDDFHAQYIPYTNVVNAVKASLEEGLRIAIGSVYVKDSRLRKDIVIRKLSKDLRLSAEELQRKIIFIESPPTRVGRATAIDESLLESKPPLIKPCLHVGSAIGILPNGDTLACCGHTALHHDIFRVANINNTPFPVIVKRIQKNVLYWLLFMRGPYNILKDYFGVEVAFPHTCDACNLLIRNYLDRLHKIIKDNLSDIIIKDILLAPTLKEQIEAIKSIADKIISKDEMLLIVF